MDMRTGAFVDRDLAGSLVPVHADIPHIDAVILGGDDEKVNPFGV
jgi:xanthine dehydrogenase YagR molybdenum-binding subunit